MGNEEKAAFTKAFRIFLRAYYQERLRRGSERLRALKEALSKEEDECYRAALELAELQDSLEQLKREGESAATLDDDFEKILAMEGVRLISVDEHQGHLRICTKRIMQVVRLQIEGKTQQTEYDIGQFHIVIRLLEENLTKDSIIFLPGEYRGTHSHPHAGATGYSVCFGSPLNQDISKLIADFKIAPLVHLLLSFLRWDEANPVPLREPSKKETPQQYDPIFEFGYRSPDERAMAKRAYAALLHKAKLIRANRLNSQALKEAEEEFSKYLSRVLDLRNQMKGAEKILARYRMRASNLEYHVNEQIEAFIGAGAYMIRQEYAPQSDETALCINFSFRNLSLELEIKSDALPKLRGIPSDHPLSLKVDPNGYFILDTHTLKELSKLHARASFVEYLHAVIELLRAGKLDERRRRQ
ncbi:MAG: hypothetical protein A3J67_02590 [Parcubacteria group bacterium RIFCSPHIGHO2_02_FULL_48_10b]|nr:MAG: hypothetical protein A3J67_02590 [Parcubacteria group bacterium RIFCSPHIGHO2_02_FULL_48_10b]